MDSNEIEAKSLQFEAKMPHENHSNHLCYLVNIQLNFGSIKEIVKDARFICKNCARVAHNKENLCSPIKL